MVEAISAGTQLFGAAMSVIQGIQAKKEQKKAEATAAKMVAAAKKTLSVNYLEAVGIQTDAYDREFQAGVASSQQALEMLQESGQRAAIGGVGRVNAVNVDANAAIRESMQDDLYTHETAVATEDAAIRDKIGQLELDQAAGAQEAAAFHAEQAAAGFTGAIEGVAGAAQTIYENKALYKKEKGPKIKPEVKYPWGGRK